jgi:hypothetical protein
LLRAGFFDRVRSKGLAVPGLAVGEHVRLPVDAELGSG